LNRGEVGQKKMTKESALKMVQSIDRLKTYTEYADRNAKGKLPKSHKKYCDKNSKKFDQEMCELIEKIAVRDSINFPIQVKHCDKKGACRGSKQNSLNLVESDEGIFGNAGKLSNKIPVPKSAKEFLPRQKHSESHLYAVCYDQQDECDGMLWVPKNLAMCNGWFKGDDARASLGFIRDAIKNGAWSALWNPKSAKIRTKMALTGKSAKDAQKRAEVSSADAAETEGIIHPSRPVHHGECKKTKWEESQAADKKKSNQEVLKHLKQELEGLDYNERDQGYYSEALGKDAVQEKLTEAKAICEEAKEAGEGFDCDSDKTDEACESLQEECRRHGVDLSKTQCMTKEDLSETLRQAKNGASSGKTVTQSKAVARSKQRKQREADSSGADLMMDLLFPPYYYRYQPFCYPWYGGPTSYGFNDGYYGYPLVPNYGWGGGSFGGYYGYHGGYGMYGGPPPGVWLLQGLGRLAETTFRGLAWAGAQILEGASNFISGAAKFVGELWDGCFPKDGQASEVCIVIVAVLAAFFALFIAASVWFFHCRGKDENCRSWWYRGGRMRKKMRNWLSLWDAIEDDIYTTRGGQLLFDAVSVTQDQCLKKMQWGRDWVKMEDNEWDVAPVNGSDGQTNFSKKI